jgi:hypothetical protein
MSSTEVPGTMVTGMQAADERRCVRPASGTPCRWQRRHEIEMPGSLDVFKQPRRALAQIEHRQGAGELADLGRHLLQELLGRLAILVVHQFADPDPFLRVGGLDDVEQGDAAAGAPRPPAGIAQGHRHFRTLVHHHQEDAPRGLGRGCGGVRFGRLAHAGHFLRNRRWAIHPASNAPRIATTP